jgi:nickel-dependent lactate racemase
VETLTSGHSGAAPAPASAVAAAGALDEAQVRAALAQGLARAELCGKRVLIIVPDGTRTAPLPLFFRLLYELLGQEVAALDYLIALGTHQPMGEAALSRHLGVALGSLSHDYAKCTVHQHRWDLPETFVTLGTIPASEVEQLSEGLLSLDVPVTINRLVLAYDQLLICGPVFPHEVVGFSGGYKYFFPGISGPEMINVTHWLSALRSSTATIGFHDTPVRAMINRAAALVPTPTLCCAFVTHDSGLAGVFVGDPHAAWRAAATLSEQLHITYVPRPFQRVLAVVPDLYDDLWTAAKGVYKAEPAIADGGEVVLYGPQLSEISYTHGRILDEVGYHVRDYFVKQWERFRHYPWGVLAHSAHVAGRGSYDVETGIETPRIKVTLATAIPRARCARVNLGYLDPASIVPDEWANREDEGVLLVPHAGEHLYRVRGE